MKEFYPSYYHSFCCSASACHHSCCIGWEIDIDEDTAAYYAAMPGAIGDRLRENIDFSEPAVFRLGEGERCPFLNRKNLCDLILTLGEDSLCGICAEHPRFHNEYDDRVESGVGLCCEAAAALILGQKEPFRLEHRGRRPAHTEPPEVLLLRDRLLRVATDRSKPLTLRCGELLKLCGGTLPERRIREWAELFLSLEQMDGTWTDALRALAAAGDSVDLAAYTTFAAAYETEYENLLCYFLYRQFGNMAEEWGAGAAAAFALLSARMVFLLHALHWTRHGIISFDERLEYARLYSAEIEYSDENPARILAVLCSGEKRACVTSENKIY